MTDDEARELLGLIDRLDAEAARARADARIAAFRLERLRSGLAYRIGRVLTADARKPGHWLRLPLALHRELQAYRAERAAARPELDDEPAPPTLRDGRAMLVARRGWQALRLPGAGAPGELWLTVLGPPAAGPVRLQWQDDDAASTTLELAAGRPRGLPYPAGPARRVRLQALGAEPCLLKLELDAPPQAAAAGSDDAPAPEPDAVLWQAHRLMLDDGEPERALALARRHAPPSAQAAIHLLEAHCAAADEAGWLRHVNAYVARYGLAPLELRAGDGDRFARLHAPTRAEQRDGPLVSVLMPAWNAEATVRYAVRSILAQTWRALELIVVDDASGDGTWNLLRELAAADPRVKLLRNPANVGPYVSKNRALALAGGAYVTGHDADDWAHPQRLERHLAEAMAGGLEVSIAGMLRLDEHGRFTHFSRLNRSSPDGALREATMSCLFDARVLKQRLGYWDSVRFGADTEMIERARRVCGCTSLRQLAILCRDSAGSLTNDPLHGVSRVHGVSASRRQYREHWTRWHQASRPEDLYLPFPQARRPFPAPQALRVTP